MPKLTNPYVANQSLVGYMVNTPFSEENQRQIVLLQEQITSRFGHAIWAAPPESLHITLFDWLAPLVDYGRDKDALFNEIKDGYDGAFRAALEDIGPINVTFDEIVAFPDAIIIRGHDDGSYAAIRDEFVAHVDLLPNTKLPPKIIHSSIIRFNEAIEFDPLEEYVGSLEVNLRHTTDRFRLLRESRDPLLEFTQLNTYILAN